MPGNLDKPRSVCYTGNTIPARSVCRLKEIRPWNIQNYSGRHCPFRSMTDDARASALREGVRQYSFHAALTRLPVRRAQSSVLPVGMSFAYT